MSNHTPTPWMWAWRDDEDAPASIFSMKREGHAYAVAMCPRYQTAERWVEDAKFILCAVNSHEAHTELLNEVLQHGHRLPAELALKIRNQLKGVA